MATKGKAMQTAVMTQEAQPSLFAFKLSTPRRFPARLSFFAQDIVEALIKEPRTAEDLAEASCWEYDAVIEQLRTLRDAGLVTAAEGSVDGDLECSSIDCSVTPLDWAEGSERERGSSCPCENGVLIDSCRWRYFGGAISEFFNYIQSKGLRDGIQS